MSMDALVVGGTGPTGIPLVNHLLRAGANVTVFHSGAHEASFEADVEHLHADARDPGAISVTLAQRRWDVAICTSGRLRALASHLGGKVGRLVGITGQPVYDGTMRPTPSGAVPLPVPEWAPRQASATGYTGKVAAGEDQLFAQQGSGEFEAVVVRYPGIYGPRSYLAHEWAVVKRILAGRFRMALPHGGATYFQRGYAENVAWLVYLAATRPEASGHAFNAGDEQVLSARHVAELICHELEHAVEFVDVPAAYCRGAYPLAEKSSIILDLSKARTLLGYRDRVPVDAATRATARWLYDNAEFGEGVDPRFAGSLEYEAEDQILARWKSAVTAMETQN